MGCKTACCDFLKVAAPGAWAVIAVLAAGMYTIVPALDSREPRYFPAALALTSGAMALGCAVDVWVLWRTAAYSTSLRSSADVASSLGRLRLRRAVTLFVAVGLVALAVVLGVVGPDVNMCGHASCGADVAWTAIGIAFLLAWTLIIQLKINALVRSPADTATGSGGAELTSVASRA